MHPFILTSILLIRPTALASGADCALREASGRPQQGAVGGGTEGAAEAPDQGELRD